METTKQPQVKDRVLFAQMVRVGLENYIAQKTSIEPKEASILLNWTVGAEREFRDAWELVAELVADSECYCADAVAASGPCAHCKAREFLARGIPARR